MVLVDKKNKYICMKILSVVKDLLKDLTNNIKGFFNCTAKVSEVKQVKQVKKTDSKKVKAGRKSSRKKGK